MWYSEILPYMPLAIFVFYFCAFLYRLIKSRLSDHKLEIFSGLFVSGVICRDIGDISKPLQNSVYIILILMLILLVYSILITAIKLRKEDDLD
jgi:hypothetical protein